MTPLADYHAKIDLIEHLNEEHREELLVITQAYADAQAEEARLLDIYEEGCLVDIAQGEAKFIPFILKGDLEENILYLAYDAMARQGKSLDSGNKAYFTVKSSRKISANMLRLTVHSAVPLPYSPGYALYFSLKTLRAIPSQTMKTTDKLPRPMQWLNLAFLKIMTYLSANRRRKIFEAMGKNKRYYTLHGMQADGTALIDIYLHGDNPGSLWAQQLKPGDIIHSLRDYHEHTEHLHEGQSVLIGDETSFSTIAAILNEWRNPHAPMIIAISHHEAEQHYFDDIALPSGTIVHRLRYHQHLANDIIALLDNLAQIDTVWGALENETAKAVRHHLRKNNQLDGRHNRIKAYWQYAPQHASQ